MRALRTLRIGMALAAVMAVAGLTGGDSASGQEKMSLKVVFATPPTTYGLPHFVAKDLGWLDKAGLKVEEVWLTGDANAVRALLAGQGDIAAPGVFAVYSAITEGAKIKAIGSWQPKADYQLLANEKIADGLANELLVLAGEVTARIDGVLTPLAN